MIHHRAKRLAAALLSSVLIAGPALAEPALWVVKDADSTMHLFGTMHLLKPGTSWRGETLDKAFAGAQEVWFETDVAAASDPANLQPFLPLMLDVTKPLSQRLPAETFGRLKAKLDTMGIPIENLAAMRTWMVMLTLAGIQMTAGGYDPKAGVEQVLNGGLSGRPMRTFEGLEEQLRFFADLPETVQVQLLDDTLEQIDRPGYLDKLAAAWSSGDMAALESLYMDEIRRDQPEAYEVFIAKRNRAWAEKLAAEMAGAGTDFVAVGALHMVGPDGLPALLKAKGFTVERVN